MSNGVKVALAVGAGYLLGRTRKMRLALMLAGAGLTGKFPAHATDLVAHGVKSIGSSNQVGDLTDQLRGGLVDAAKAAVVAAAANRVDALNDRLQGISAPSGDGRGVLAGRERSRSSDDEDLYDDVEEVDGEEEEPASDREDEYEDAEVVDEDEYDDESEDEEPDDESEPEADQSRRPRRGTGRQAPAPSLRRRSAEAASDHKSTGRRPGRRKAVANKRAPVRRGG